MKTREEALEYGLSFPDTYKEALFHDSNWQIVRVKGSRKAFLWTYERNGKIWNEQFIRYQTYHEVILCRCSF